MDLVRHTYMLTMHGQISLRGKKNKDQNWDKKAVSDFESNLTCWS